MADATRRLRIEIEGDDQTGSTLDGVGGKLKGFATVAAGVAAAVGVAAGAITVGLANVGQVFGDALDTIQIQTGAAGSELDSLNDSFRDVFATIPVGAQEAADALSRVHQRTGLTGQGLEDLTGQMLNLSRMTGTDVTQSIEQITRLFGDWGVATEDQAATMDKLFRASQESGVGIDRLSEAATKFGAPLRQMGFEFDQTIGLLAKFEEEGVNTELVMGSLRIALGKVARAGGDPVEALTSTVEAIKAAGSAGEANALALELFGAKAGPDMAAAIREGRFELGDLLDVIQSGESTIAGTAAATDGFTESWQLLKNKGMLAIEPAATAVLDKLGELTDWIMVNGGPALDVLQQKLQPVADWLGRAQVAATPLVEGFTQLSASLAATGLTAEDANTKLQPFADGMSSVWSAIQTAIDAAMPRIQEAMTWFATEWETIGPLVAEYGGQLVETIGSILELIALAIGGAVVVMTYLWDTFGRDAFRIVSGAFELILGVVSGVLQMIQGVVEVFIGIFTGDWSRAWEGILMIGAGSMRSLQGILSGGFQIIMGIVGIFQTFFTQAWNNIRNAAQFAATQIVGTAQSMGERVGTAIKGGVDRARIAFAAGFAAMQSAASSAAGAILARVAGLASGIIGYFAALPGRMRAKGYEIISSLADGISAAIGRVTSAISSVTKKISGFLPGSPVKEGDLRVLNNGYAGRQILRMVADGVSAEQPRLAARMAAATAMTVGRAASSPRPAETSTVLIDLRGAIAPNTRDMEDLVVRALSKVGRNSAGRVAVAGRTI